VVVLPTPPFWLAIVITRQEGGLGHSCSVPPSAANAAWATLIAGAAWTARPAVGAPPAPGAPPGPGTLSGLGTLSGPAAVPGPATPSGPGTLPGPGTSFIRGTPPAGLPRVLTVPLPCDSPAATASPPAGPPRLVSRETAADNACFTRASGLSGLPTLESCPCPRTCLCSTTPAAPVATWETAPATPLAVRFFVLAAAVLVSLLAGRCGQPSPSATSRDSSRADARENPVDSSGHPTPSGEAITALLFVPPGRPRRCH
jgi:hypothetical protein